MKKVIKKEGTPKLMKFLSWLPTLDSNQDSKNQNLVCYRYTNRHQNTHHVTRYLNSIRKRFSGFGRIIEMIAYAKWLERLELNQLPERYKLPTLTDELLSNKDPKP